jgi:hypothetical protein
MKSVGVTFIRRYTGTVTVTGWRLVLYSKLVTVQVCFQTIQHVLLSVLYQLHHV